MSEAATEAPATEAAAAPPVGGTTAEEAKTFDADYVAKIRAEAAKYRTEARATAAELEKIRQSSMTETEKAVAEAEARGRITATQDFGKRLATSKFEALASKRNSKFDTTEMLSLIDTSRFVTDDGEPDEKAIAAAVEKLVPPAEGAIPNFDGGGRPPAPKTTDMNSLIRRQAGYA